jgi:acyl phosphate:glycerol-3-phosphate acyltransferase
MNMRQGGAALMMQSMLCIPLGYFLGSINAASIIAWIVGRIDMRKEPDGRVSAAEVHHKLGLCPFVLVVFFDALLPMSAVLIASYLSNGNKVIMMLAGVAALVGHNWSMFIKFKGGLGATAMLGILIGLVTWPLFIGASVALIVALATRRFGLATVIGVCTISIATLVVEGLSLLAVYPLTLLSVMSLKRYQIKRLTQTTHWEERDMN